MPDSNGQPSLCQAIARETRQRLAGWSLAAGVFFAGATGYNLWRAASARAAASAQVAAQVLAASNGQAAPVSISRVVDACDDVLAAAVTSADRTIQSVWPADTATREAARSVLCAGRERGTMTLRTGDASESARYFVFTDPRDGAATIIWIHDRGVMVAWAAQCAVFVGLFVYLQRRFTASFAAWLKRRVGQPLAALAVQRRGEDRARALADGLTTGGWTELESLARHIGDLQTEMQAADRRHRHFKRRAADQILANERTYRRRLRHTAAQALVDPLTALHNRRFLESELEGIFTAQRDAGADLAVAMLDLDDFKQYNDTFGHQAGDALLRFTGDLLRGSIRADDFAIRYGGDEFLLVMPGVALEDGRKIVVRIVALFAQFTAGRPEPCPVSLSAGLASRRHTQARCGQDLIAAADAALYRAKSDGKNHVALC